MFITPGGKEYAEFYKQNDSISTFARKVKSVSVSGSKIKLVLQPETVKFKNGNASGALNVHDGFVNSGVGSLSLGSGSTSSYKAGMNLPEKKLKFTEKKPGTTVTAVLNSDGTLKSLSVNSPYILESTSTVESKKLYILMDGAVKSSYTFSYK